MNSLQQRTGALNGHGTVNGHAGVRAVQSSLLQEQLFHLWPHP